MRLSNDFDRFCAAVRAGRKPPVPALYLGQRDLGHVVAVAERIHRLCVSVTQNKKKSPLPERFFLQLSLCLFGSGMCTDNAIDRDLCIFVPKAVMVGISQPAFRRGRNGVGLLVYNRALGKQQRDSNFRLVRPIERDR